MTERPIDTLRVEVLELQAQVGVAREELFRLWLHALVITSCVIVIVSYLWWAER